MRPINGDSLLMKLKQHRLLFIEAYGDFSNFSEKDKARIDEIDNCIAEIINAPTIDPEGLRPKGKWIEREHEDVRGNYNLFHCSRCDEPNARKKNYCPNCGAKMEINNG